MLQELADLAIVAVRDRLGESVTYDRGGVESSITGEFDPAGVRVEIVDGIAVQSRAPRLFVRLADLPDDRAEVGDAWTARGFRYRVAEVDPDGHGAAVLRGERTG